MQKRLLAISLALVLSFSFYFYSSQVGRNPTGNPPPSTAIASPAVEKNTIIALLGAKENPAALWFPFIGANFQPKVALYNTLPLGQPRPRTPLFIGFTRNHLILEQTVLSYISAGWPREDIIVVDNSGTFDANNQGLLSETNPSALDYDLYRYTYGVSIIQTPTLFNFAQLMNFYLRTAITQKWPIFFWSHQDVVVLGDETAQPYKSFYQRVLEVLASVGIHSQHDFETPRTAKSGDWAIKFFSFDWLALVNVEPWRTIGPWDTFIPYYNSDCDAYSRLVLHGFTKEHVVAGFIFDVLDAIPDLRAKLFSADLQETPNSPRFDALRNELDEMMANKMREDGVWRNTWQERLQGGKGEPWTYDPKGFGSMWWDTAEYGRLLYMKKWGTDECVLQDHGIMLSDQFKSY